VGSVRSTRKLLRIGGNVMNKTRNRSPADTEIIAVLIAISHVSARLARNLSILAADRQPLEGGKESVKNGRNGSDHQ
jgi:hypothetical protein